MEEKNQSQKAPIQESFLIINFKKEIEEAKRQIEIMLQNLQSWNSQKVNEQQQINRQNKQMELESRNGLNQIQYIKKELEKNNEHLEKKIKGFINKLKQFQQNINPINAEPTIDFIIDWCSMIQDQMKNFYEQYKILWAQQYYLTQRQLILSNQIEQEQYDLITYILQ